MFAVALRSVIAAGCLAGVVAIAGCARGSAKESASGAELYGSCIACHGTEGAGTPAVGAPAIAGLPEWYVTSQVQRFQTGLRGKHPDDVEGLKMRAMSRQLSSEAEVAAVAAYVSALPKPRNPAAITTGDTATGQAAFALCVGCHGPNGEGNQAVNAPPLAGLDDWYVAAQLRKFRAGIRGTTPEDTIGPVMQAMSLAVAPESIDHLAAYVHSLQK